LWKEAPLADDPLDEVDDDDGDFADLPDDGEAEEATAEQRALLASFEMKRRDEAARQFMVAERRVAADRVTAEQCLKEADQRGAMARQRRDGQYPLASFEPWQERTEDRETFTDYLEDAARCRLQVREDRQRRRQQANRRSDDGAGPSGEDASPSGVH
jgi:hypothetical protein